MITIRMVEQVRSNLTASGLKEIEATVGDDKFSYFVMPQSMSNDLPDFAFQMVSPGRNYYILGVSDSVPEIFRPYWVYHEFVEYIKEPDSPDGCVNALEQELSAVPDDIKPEYLPRRLAFFTRLVKFAQDRQSEYTQEHVHKFDKSRVRLEQIIRGSQLS